MIMMLTVTHNEFGKMLRHQFTATQSSWGYQDFMDARQALPPGNGWITDDQLVAQVTFNHVYYD